MKILPLFLLSIIVSLPLIAQEHTSLYDKAESAYRAGDVNAAIIHVKNLLKSRADDLSARLLFAKILLESGELAAAQEQYNRALKLKVDKSLVIIPLAQSLLLQNKAQEIIDLIKIGKFETTTNALIYVYRAKAYMQMQDVASAEQQFELALSLVPTETNALLGLSSIALHKNDISLAKDYIAQAKIVDPKSSYLWFFEGEMQRRLNNNSNALVAYDTAISLDNENYDALRSRSTLYLDSGDLTLAKEDLDKVLINTPDDPVAQLLKAIYLFKVDQKNDAKALVSSVNDQLSLIEPVYLDQFSPLLLINGMSQYMAGNNQDAKINLNRYLKQNPDSNEARGILAEIAFLRGQTATVINLLQPIELQFISARSALVLVTAFLADEQYSQGLSIVDKLPQRIAERYDIQKIKAVLLVKSGKIEQALEVLKEQTNKGAQDSVYLMLGYSYLELDMLAEAKELAITLAKNDSASLKVFNFIATVYLANKEYDKAEGYYRKALEISPNDHIVNLNLSQLLIKFRRFDEAEVILTRMNEQSPRNINILPIYAYLFEQQLRFEDVIEIYEILDSLKFNHLPYKYKLADLYLHENKADEALEKAKEINKIEPLSATAMIIKAKAYLQKNDLANAQRTLKIIVGLYTKDSEKLIEIAKLQVEAKDWQYVDNTLELIAAQSPNSPEIILINASKLKAQGQLAGALKLLKAIKVKTAETNWLIAELYFNQGDYANAKPYAEQAYKLESDESSNLLLVKVYWQLKDQNKAFDQFERWLKLQPNDWKAFRLYANLLTIAGKKELSIEMYQKVLAIKADDIFSLNNVALLYLESNNVESALIYSELALKVSPHDAKVNDTHGWILVQNQQYKKGLQYLRESLSRDVKNPYTLYHIGVTLSHLGREVESLEILNKAITKTKSKELIKKITAAIDAISAKVG